MTEISNSIMIKNSLEWVGTKDRLIKISTTVPYGRDLRKMISNIDPLVTELSRAEVIARRRKFYKVEELLSKINNDISLIEEYMIVAKLMS